MRDEDSCSEVIVAVCEHAYTAAKDGNACPCRGCYYADVVLLDFSRYLSTPPFESPAFELCCVVYTRLCVAGSPILSECLVERPVSCLGFMQIPASHSVIFKIAAPCWGERFAQVSTLRIRSKIRVGNLWPIDLYKIKLDPILLYLVISTVLMTTSVGSRLSLCVGTFRTGLLLLPWGWRTHRLREDELPDLFALVGRSAPHGS